MDGEIYLLAYKTKLSVNKNIKHLDIKTRSIYYALNSVVIHFSCEIYVFENANLFGGFALSLQIKTKLYFDLAEINLHSEVKNVLAAMHLEIH